MSILSNTKFPEESVKREKIHNIGEYKKTHLLNTHSLI